MLCSVLTPYYNEDVLFSSQNLEEPNEDGVSILFYLQKIYPGDYVYSENNFSFSYFTMILMSLYYFIFYLDEWTNFLERVKCTSEEELRGKSELEEELRLWASHRGQTLSRTGMK